MTSTIPRSRENRYFPRTEYRAYAVLVTTHKKWPVHILDISFNGALVANLKDNDIKASEEIILTIEVDGSEPIKMQGRVAHVQEHYIGIECRATSIDHQHKLRQLVDRSNDPMQRSLTSLVSD